MEVCVCVFPLDDIITRTALIVIAISFLFIRPCWLSSRVWATVGCWSGWRLFPCTISSHVALTDGLNANPFHETLHPP